MPGAQRNRRVMGGFPGIARLPGLLCWLKADAILGLSDGTAVSSWLDSSGKGNTATQATGTNQPLYKTGITNGLPGVLFDGSNDFIATPSVALSTFTLFIVFKLTGTAGLIYEQSVDTNSNDGSYLLGTVTRTINCVRGGTGDNYDLTSNWAVDNAVKQVTHFYGGGHASHGMRINGADSILTTGISTGINGTATSAIYLGARSGGAVSPSNGYIFEFIVCSPALPKRFIAPAETSLRQKWGAP